jgi:hypothetical protein
VSVNESFVAPRRALPGFVTVLLLFLGAAGPMKADADGGNPNLVHACVNRWIQVRIVGPNDACDPGERSLHWVLTGPEGPAPQPGQATCPTGSVVCGGAGCINVMTDVTNCGGCGRACQPGRSRLQGSLWGRRLDDAGVFQWVLDARCMGPRDANWRRYSLGARASSRV